MRFSIAVSLVSIAASGCGGADTVTSPVRREALTLTASATVLEAGEKANITALLTGPDGRLITEGDVIWQANNANVAVVTATGRRTATVTWAGPGTTGISASIAGLSNTVQVQSMQVAVTTQRAFTYSEQDGFSFIPTPVGAWELYPSAINDLGQVVGSIQYQNAPSHAFVWSRADGMTDLGLLSLPGASQGTSARAISQTGKVVGSGSAISGATNSYQVHAFQWSKATGMIDIGVPLTGVYSHAVGINSSGEVAGYTWDNQGPQPFRWSEARGMERFPSLNYYLPTAINDAGQILLVLSQDDGDFYGGVSVLSAAGVKTDIIKCNMCNAAAWAMNGKGAVAGTDGKHAFVWTSDGGIRPLAGLPATFISSEATGINDNGTVIGSVRLYSSPWPRPFIWSASGGYREIAVPAGQNSIYFTGINNKDQIVGYVQ